MYYVHNQWYDILCITPCLCIIMVFVHNHASDQNCNVMPWKYLHSNKYLQNSHQYINMDYIMEFLCLSE